MALMKQPPKKTVIVKDAKNSNKKEIVSTKVSKPKVGIVAKQPSYKYVEADVALNRNGKQYTKKDSLDYKKAFQNETGVKGLSNKVFFNGYNPGKIEGNEEKNKKKNFKKKK